MARAAMADLAGGTLLPVQWVEVAFVMMGGLVALRLAPTRWGWAAAVALSVLATPRLLSYMFMTFIAAVREPASSLGSAAHGPDPADPS
jgi:hypothetical protein